MSLPQLTPEQEIEYAIQLNYTLQQPPEGVTPDFEHGDTIAYQLYITAGVCFTLMILFTVFRILNVSVFKRKTYLLDESIFILGFVRSPRVPTHHAVHALTSYSCYVWSLSP
jgi:hypothetical protein